MYNIQGNCSNFVMCVRNIQGKRQQVCDVCVIFVISVANCINCVMCVRNIHGKQQQLCAFIYCVYVYPPQ